MERKPRKLTFEGITVVALPDDCTREAVRFFRNGSITAVLQKNGNVGASGTGLFDAPRTQLKMARCLHGLKLLSCDMLARYQANSDDRDAILELASLEDSARTLGCKFVKPRKAKTIKRTYHSRTQI